MKHIKRLPTNCFKRWLFLVRVEGESAWPYLVPGQLYFASAFLKPREGDFIVFQNPRDKDEVLVKRAERIKGDAFYVGGTVSWASSSEDFGLVPRKSILGRIIGL